MSPRGEVIDVSQLADLCRSYIGTVVVLIVHTRGAPDDRI